MRHIREQLVAAEGRFVDKSAAYDAVVAAFKAEYGWPSDLTELERTVGGKQREVYINRLHWMTARLCREGIIESVANRPFIALAGHLAAAEDAYGTKTRKRARSRGKAPRPEDTPAESAAPRPLPDHERQPAGTISNRPPKKIVEDVLGPARTRALWSANYFPALPFTPQDFQIGALLPAMFYMARFGHRRGKGRFAEAFGRADAQPLGPPTIASVAEVLTANDELSLEGFDDETGRMMLGDLLLSWCLENKKHNEGQDQQVQRVLPTHYFASWLDLPDTVASLRGIPELLTTILAADDTGQKDAKASAFPVGISSYSDSPLLASFSRHCETRGPHRTDLAGDFFNEGIADDIGVDELLTIRLAQECGFAPEALRGDARIPNRIPIAARATSQVKIDLGILFSSVGPRAPRTALLAMFEAASGLGLLNLTLSTGMMLVEWERNGSLPAQNEQRPWPLFVDASQGQDSTLREFSEASVSECLHRLERLPIIMMLLRILDDRARNDRRLAQALPDDLPDATALLNLLGALYKEKHDRAEAILDRIFEDCIQLAEELASADADTATRLRDGSPWTLAEVFCELMGRSLQMNRFLKALESMFMSDGPNGLAVRRRVSRTINGQRRSIEVRSIVLSTALLDFLVHRHLYISPDNEAIRALSFQQFLTLLRQDYGLYVDQEPPGQAIPREMLRQNKGWLERRLRDLGLLIGVNDAESMKQLRPRYQ